MNIETCQKERPSGYKPAIHCRFSLATMERIEEIAEVTGNHLNKTIAILVDMILPYVKIEEVVETRRRVSIDLPEIKTAQKKGGKRNEG